MPNYIAMLCAIIIKMSNMLSNMTSILRSHRGQQVVIESN